jgi:murein DD-endopeptidase MepM/ murein hydrolase activator NlpD
MRYISRYPGDLETEPTGSVPDGPVTGDAASGDEPAPGDAMSAEPAGDAADAGPPGDQEPEPPLWTTADGDVVHLPPRAVDRIVVVRRPPERSRPWRPGIRPPLERLRRQRAINRVGRLIRQATRLGPRTGAGGPRLPVFAARLGGRNFRIVTRPRGLRHEILSIEPEVTLAPGLDEELGAPAEPITTAVPFAPPPPVGSYWPVQTAHPQIRVVAYLTAGKKTIGRSGRRFMAGRKGTRNGVANTPRNHAGIDLFARRRDPVIACEDGTIREFAFFYKAKSGQRTYRLLVEHSRCVVNYGELTGDSLARTGLKVGSRVRAGQVIGYVSDTDMLHFEMYRPGTTTSHQWWTGSSPPAELLNPTRYLLHLSQQGRSAGTAPPVSPGQGARGAQPAPAGPAVATPAPVVGVTGEAPRGPFGTVTFTAPGQRPFQYPFTPDDVVWTARLLQGEAGGEDNLKNVAVVWALVNRFTIFHGSLPDKTFADFIRRYSTVLQPYLKNPNAIARAINTSKRNPNNPALKWVTIPPGTFVSKGKTHPRGQYQKHLTLQQTPWSRLRDGARRVAERVLTGREKSPIGLASDFDGPHIFLAEQLRKAGKDANEIRRRSPDEYRRLWTEFTKQHASKKGRKWIGEASPQLQQMTSNAFYLDPRTGSLPRDAVRIVPA